MNEQGKSQESTEEELERRAIYENPEGKRANLNPEVPFNHKWFRGEFHTAPWGSETSPFGGRPRERVRVSMPGKKIHPAKYNGVASVYGVITAVVNPQDREFINQYGWWRTESLSRTGKNKRRKL